jgi:hypothetical protein
MGVSSQSTSHSNIPEEGAIIGLALGYFSLIYAKVFASCSSLESTIGAAAFVFSSRTFLTSSSKRCLASPDL